MKKIWVLLALLTFLVIIAIRPVQYLGWKTITIEGAGSFRVPADWIYTIEDGLVYLTDRPLDESGCRIYLAETIINGNFESNKMFGSIKHIGIIKCANLSNSATYGISEYEYNGIVIERYFLYLYSEARYPNFIAWDKLVDEIIMEKIAESYAMEI